MALTGLGVTYVMHVSILSGRLFGVLTRITSAVFASVGWPPEFCTSSDLRQRWVTLT